MGSRILLVEDEPGLRLALTDRLTAEGYSVETAADGDQGVLRATTEPFELVILDVILPGRSGLDVCSEMRHKGIATPVLILSARRELVDRVVGLKLGADDYMTKPFAMAELLARVEARLRKSTQPAVPPARYRFGTVQVELVAAEAVKDGQRIDLSAKEFMLLRYFIKHRDKALTRNELLNGVWGCDALSTPRTVDTHVAWLRRKLEPNPHHPQYILTLHGHGYKFVG